MKNRKKYIIDKEFQLKKSITVAGYVTLIIALVIIAAGVIITLNNREIETNNTDIIKNTKDIKRNMDIQQENLINYSLLPGGLKSNNKQNTPNDLTSDYNKSMDILNSAISSNENMLKSNSDIMMMNTWLLIAIVVVTFIGIALLFMQIIKHTHRVSGPIFLMSRYIKEILNGNYPEMRNLRTKDDLKDFYLLFRQMADRLVELEKKNKR